MVNLHIYANLHLISTLAVSELSTVSVAQRDKDSKLLNTISYSLSKKKNQVIVMKNIVLFNFVNIQNVTIHDGLSDPSYLYLFCGFSLLVQ